MTYSQPTEPPNPSSPQTTEYDNDLIVNTVIYDELYIPEDEDLDTYAKFHLRQQTETSTLATHGDCYVFGNSRGVSLIEKMESMERDVKILQHENRSFQSQLEDERSIMKQERSIMERERSKIASLEYRMGQLSQHAEGYLHIRRRFLETYKRDVKDVYTHKGAMAVKLGNARAHQGDALVDASLFAQDNRYDKSLYRELYGFDYTKIIELQEAAMDDGDLIHLINTHASLLAQGKTLSNDLQQAFGAVITEAEKSWLKPPNGDPRSPFRRACNEFFTKLGKNRQ